MVSNEARDKVTEDQGAWAGWALLVDAKTNGPYMRSGATEYLCASVSRVRTRVTTRLPKAHWAGVLSAVERGRGTSGTCLYLVPNSHKQVSC